MMFSILIPVYNEEAILESHAIKAHEIATQKNLDHEIIVISNGSTDQTCAIGERLSQTYPWFRFFSLPHKTVGGAFATGVKNAKGEFIISLDADLSFEMNFLDYARDLLVHGDMIVGSKTLGAQRRSFIRVFASQMYLLVSQLVFGLTLSDFSIGCKAYRREVILPIVDHLDSWTGYVLEICTYLHLKNKKIIQIGVDCNDTRKSHFNLLHEGFYRYSHLYRCYKLLKDKTSWMHQLQS
jgi:glycosyltransferase involved in cell wall biosynthesis